MLHQVIVQREARPGFSPNHPSVAFTTEERWRANRGATRLQTVGVTVTVTPQSCRPQCGCH